MLELILLGGFAVALGDLARKRAAKPWLYIVLMLFGYGVIVVLSAALGATVPAMFFGMLWCLALYGFVWFATKRRRAGAIWQCPECTSWNDPDAVVCGCGYRPSDIDPAEERQGELNA